LDKLNKLKYNIYIRGEQKRTVNGVLTYFGGRGGESSEMCVRGLMQNEFVRTGKNAATLGHWRVLTV
jgi:hypothetical protein